MPRLDSRGTDCAGSSAVSLSGQAQLWARGARYSGVAELLFQVADDRAWAVSGTRFVHSIDEAKEYVAAFEGRIADHASRPGILRLSVRFHHWVVPAAHGHQTVLS